MANEDAVLAIVGGGMAAGRLIQELLSRDYCQRFSTRIVVIGAEAEIGYNRVLLSSLLAGEIEREELLAPVPSEEVAKWVTFLPGKTVTRLDCHNRDLALSSGEVIHYDRAVLATGSLARHSLPSHIEIKEGISAFRTLADTEALMSADLSKQAICILGAGFLGLEAAEGLRNRAASVTVLQRSGWPLNRQLGKEGGERLRHLMEERGISFECGHQVKDAKADENGQIKAIQLDDGRWLPADRLIQATGIIPNIGLGRLAGLDCNVGILVDDQLMTSDPYVYALGECVEFKGKTFGLVEPIWQQAKVLAEVLCQQDSALHVSESATRLKISGIDLYSFGDPSPQSGDCWWHYEDSEEGDYRALCINGGKVRSGYLIGDTELGSQWFEHAKLHSQAPNDDRWLFRVDTVQEPSQIAVSTQEEAHP